MTESRMPEGYAEATEGTALLERSGRVRYVVSGRSPREMLDGILTCTIPGSGTPVEEGVLEGRGYYGLVLTPKGKIVTDLRAFPVGADPEPGFLLDVPEAGRTPLQEHFQKFLPPRLAKAEDVSGATGMLTVMGPEAPELLTREALGLRVDPEVLTHLTEGEYRLVGSRLDQGVAVVRTGEVAAPAFDLLADRDTIRSLTERLLEAGGAELAPDAWKALRIEAGRPRFGVDMDRDTIPVEAGVHDRAIDYEKGCYTGQEVIVRIRDRGRVNWHLRGVLLGDEPPPSADTELFSPREEKGVGRITSAVYSPRFGQTAGLGYVRREVEPPAVLHLGEEGGPEAQVRELGEGWGLGEDD